MKLNAFLWNNFIESARGKAWIKFFADQENLYQCSSPKLFDFLENWGWTDDGAEEIITDALKTSKELRLYLSQGLIKKKIENIVDAEEMFRDIGDLVDETEDEDDIFVFSDMPRLAVALSFIQPKLFFPYYFYLDFQGLQKIFDEFGIFLPALPKKSDYHVRFYYYLELCKSLNTYWSALGFAPEHLPVFLYGYAPEVVDIKKPELGELPAPHRAWFVGGGINNNGDFDYLDSVNRDSETSWQGNRDTEPGDIIVLYCLSPRSEIHSIWRAVAPGAVEPFFDFYSTVQMGYPQLVPRISLKTIKADPVLSQMPLVKGSMQGINGRNIPKKFYDRILYMIEQAGGKTIMLPNLEDIERADVTLDNERDVELKILEPLLREIGFTETDWERQVKLQVGRKERAIPDYLIHTSRDAKARAVTAEWVWEAKFSVGSNDQLQKDIEQARSYAKLVDAKGVCLISKEGLWLSTLADGYSADKTRHWPAVQLNQIEHLNELRALAGKKSFTRRK